jgi:hypothetical protein
MTIDELVYELKLDTSQFSEGQKNALDSFRKTSEEMDKRQKDLELRNKNVGYSFNNITYAAEGLFTALAGAGMASFARETANSVAQTGRMAINIGESTSALSAFGRVVERNGGSAEAAMGSMKGLTDSMTRLNTFGEGSPELFKFLGIIGGAQGDSPLDTLMKFAAWAEKNQNNPQLVNIIGQSGGLDQGTINTLLQGRTEVMRQYNDAMNGAISPDQVAKLTALQNAWVKLDQSVEKTGRDVVTNFSPAITTAMTSVAQWAEHNQQLADTLGGVLTAIVALSALKPALWLLRLLGLGNPYTAAAVVAAGAATAITSAVATPDRVKSWDEAYPILGKLDAMFGLGPAAAHNSATAAGGTGPTSGGAFTSQAEKEAFIRAAAAKAGIDPNVAMRVAKSEGFNEFLGDNGTSGGAFQLHVTRGGRGRAVGDEFRKQTGLDPLDRANERQTIVFALQEAARSGWGAWHGAQRVGIGDREGIGGNVQIGDINVTTTSNDPKQHGKVVADAIRSNLGGRIVTQANTGLN